MKPSCRRITRSGLVVTALALGGCATPSWLCYLPPGPSAITLVATPDANGNAAVVVDLVMTSDEVAAKQIATLSAQDYFNRKVQLRRDFATEMQVRSWELAPGQILRDAPTNPGCNRVSTLLFARYTSPGEHRQALGNAGAIVVSLGPEEMSVSP